MNPPPPQPGRNRASDDRHIHKRHYSVVVNGAAVFVGGSHSHATGFPASVLHAHSRNVRVCVLGQVKDAVDVVGVNDGLLRTFSSDRQRAVDVQVTGGTVISRP